MRGHGLTITGSSLKEAVYNAVNTLLSARIQMSRHAPGRPHLPSADGEAAATAKIHGTVLDRNWEVWAGQAGI